MPSTQKTLANQDLRKALMILERDPGNIGANIQAGVFYSQENRLDESVRHLKKALSKEKKNVLVLEKLADVFLKQRKFKDARIQARKLLNLNKRAPAALHMMARVHEALGEYEKAISFIQKAHDADPNNTLILADMASYYSILGELEKSRTIHRRVLELKPHAPHSWWQIAQLQKLEGDDAKNMLEKIKSAIASTDIDEELRGLHYSAGKISHDIGNYTEAFEHFKQANQLHDMDVTPDKIIAANINFRESYSNKLFKMKSGMGNMVHSPIFILGQTRSGTTLTESLCAAHSNVSAGGELPYLSDMNSALQAFSVIENAHQDALYQMENGNIQGLAAEYISNTKHLTAQGRRLTDKMPHNFLNIGLIALLFPKAKIIHCRRHPMDNCLSIFSNPMLDYHKEYKSDLRVLGEYYRNYVQIMEFWKETCPIPIHEVLYEDLVTNTQAAARGMMEYLNLPWEDGVMDRSGSQKAVKTLSVWQVRQPVFQTSKGKWRAYEEQLQPLSDVLEDCINDYEAELAQLDHSEPRGDTP